MAPSNTPTKFHLSSGLLEAKHVETMQHAIWTFLCLIDWQTGDDGTVMDGGEVTAATIAERLGMSERTVRRELDLLDAKGYIRRKLSRYGWLVWIAKPKQAKKRRSRSDKTCIPGRTNLVFQVGQNMSSRSDNLVLPESRSDESVLPELRVLRAGINTLTPDSGKKEDPEKTPPTPSTAIDHEAEFAKLKAAYPKDTLINAYLTESAWVDAVLSAANPRAILDQVWAGLERMKASGTPVRWLPTLKDFLLLRRYTEAWPREVSPAADQPADVDAVMERARARRRAEQEAASR